MTVGGPAAVFARKHRQQLFPDTPLLFAAVDQRFLRDAPLGENETAVAVVNDYPRLIDEILQLLPQTKQVFMVMGSGTLGKFWRRELEEEFKRFQDRLTFVWSERSVPSGDPAPLCEPSTRLGDLLSDLRHRRAGWGVCGRASARRPSRHGECSLFGVQSVYLGSGVVGGTMMSIDNLARNTADVGHSTLERCAAEKHDSTATAARSTDIRLARAAAVGHPREPVAGGQRRALSASEPVAGIQAHGAERGRRAGSSNRS